MMRTYTLCVCCVRCVYVVCVCVCVCVCVQVEDAWESTEFVVLPHRDSKDIFILGGTDDIQVLLDDSQVRAQPLHAAHAHMYMSMHGVSVNSFSIICHLPPTHEFLGPTLRNTVGATGSNFRFQNMANNNYYRGFNCIYSIYTCTCNYKIFGHIFPSSGERIHHSWVSPRGPHQATRGGVGEEAGPFCRDSGKTNA